MGKGKLDMSNGFKNIFSTLILEFDISGHPCEKNLKDIIQRAHTNDHALMPAGGVSNFGGNILTNPILTSLKETIDIAVNKYVEASGLMPISLYNSWFNVMGKGNFTKHHRHEKSVLSGAYYIEAEPNSVGLTLVNPTKIYKMNELYDKITDYTTNDYTSSAHPGKLIIFPSWLEHYTDVNDSDRRVVVSFNYN
jgi:uncharacterized protein (TIGR02466 family)